jgi:ABC-type sugar transport system ATPase subunit
MPDLLLVRNVSKRYGGVAALDHAHFALRPGEVHALMGENGAGKSTLARIVAGVTRPDAAEIFVDGKLAPVESPLDAQRAGIGIIHQELDLFPNLTTGENMVIGNLRFAEGHWAGFARMESFCRPYLDMVGLQCGTREPVANLSIGHQQLVAIARALSMNARIILMDEPTSALFDDAAERLFHLIGGLKARGVAVVYVSHKMDEIFRICDRITVLRDGQTVGTVDTPATSAGEVIRMMVGRDVHLSGRPQREPARGTLLGVEHLCTHKLRDVSFSLHRGEVLGVAGLVGAGRSELGAALFGIDRIASGALTLRGRPLHPGSSGEAMRRGIGLVPEDRKLEGLMMQMSVLENATMAVLRRMTRFGLIESERERQALDPVRRRLALKCASADAPVSSLSGGNQQKALLARWLLLDPEVWFLDDPARGIDVAAKQDIYRIVDELAAAGKGLILASSELPELLRCCDRILVLKDGRVTAEFAAADATQENIMAAATAAVEARA